MNPEFPPNNPRAELEARLTAFILGELPAHEAAALRQAMDEDTQLAALYERLKAASKLVREAAANPVEQTKDAPAPLRLSEERRQKLLAQFKTVAPKEFVHARRPGISVRRLLEIAAVLAMMAVLAGLLLPALSKSKSKSLSAVNQLRQMEWNKSYHEADLAPEPALQSQEQTATVSSDGHSVKADRLDAVALPAPPPLANTTIVLPPTENSTAVTATTPSGYIHTSMEWNPGTGTHQPKTAPAKPYIVNAEPQDVLPALQDLFHTGKASASSSSVNTAQNSQLYQRSQTLSSSFNSGAATTSGASGGGGNAGPNTTITYANPSDISIALPLLAANSGQQFAGGAVTSVTNSFHAAGDPNWMGHLEHPVTRTGGERPWDVSGSVRGFYPDEDGKRAGVTTGERKDGKIDPLTGSQFARLLQDGSLDTNFDPGPGVVVLPPPVMVNYSSSPTDAPPGLAGPAPQVEIKAKFADVTQDNDRAVGFNWNLGTFHDGGVNPIASGGLQPSFNGTTSLGIVANPSSDYAVPASSAPANWQENIKLNGITTIQGQNQQLFALTPERSDDLTAPQVVTESGRAASTSNVSMLEPRNIGGQFSLDGSIDNSFVAGNGNASTNLPGMTGSIIRQGYVQLADDTEAVKKSHAEKQSKGPSNVYSLNVVGYIDLQTNGFGLTAAPVVSTNYISTNGAINFATDEAVRRQAGRPSRLATTNGVYSATTEMGNVTVSVDPESKRAFVITDSDAAVGVSNSIIQIDRSGGANKGAEEEANHSPAYLTKLRELDALKKVGELMALEAAQASVERQMPTTLMVEVMEHADSKPTESPTLRERISGALTGNVTKTARIKVERDVTDVPGVSGQTDMTGIYDPYFVQTESEVIRSERILDQVIDRLKLNEAWAAKKGAGTPLKTSETRALLKKSLEISPERNSSLLDIKVKSDQPEEAAKIANTIAEVYTDYRRQQRVALIEGSTKGLKDGLVEQQKKIARAEAEMAQIEKSEKPQADTPLPKLAADAPIPQPEVMTGDNAFSTFSLNIADVSFKLAAASLEKGQMPDPATIRSEEFINAFDYRDPEPVPGAPLGFAWERVQYPFAHNRDLLRFAVKTAAAGREAGQPMNIVLLLDKSGSMERADRVQIIHEALRVLATQLGPQDKLSVVTFARVARLWVDGLPGSQAGEVAEGLDKLTPEGGTNLEEAMRLAYETARRHYLAGGINRVVLLTDGAANLGNVDPVSLNEKVERHRKEGIALDCFGVGWEGYNDDLLEVLSRHGDGRYGFINTPEEAANGFAKQLAGALHVAAEDVKVQVEFNPKRVTAYRQIGYAKHQLTKDQFRDNTVDAAEIGAAESGNALYVVEVNPNGEGPLATVRVRYKVPGTEDYPEHEWAVPYDGNALSLEQASPAMRLAGTASAFSEWLATSPFAGDVTTDRLLELMRGVPETYGADERPKKLEWMIREAKSLTGK